MSQLLRRSFIVTLAATFALVGMSLPASGAPDTNLASGGKPPGGWIVDPSIYDSIFGGVGAGAPQGTTMTSTRARRR